MKTLASRLAKEWFFSKNTRIHDSTRISTLLLFPLAFIARLFGNEEINERRETGSGIEE